MTTYTPNQNQIVHHTSVDFTARPVCEPVHIVQYDNRVPILAVKIYDNDQPYIIPSSANANIRLSKPDRTFVYRPALGMSSDKTTIYFEILQNMVTHYGVIWPIIELEIAGSIAGSAPIKLIVDRNPIQNGDIESSSDFKALQEYVEEARDAMNSAKQSETNAEKSATAAKGSETAAGKSATAAKGSETAAGKSASAAKDSETAAGKSASAAKDSETAAGKSASAAKGSETAAGQSAAAAKTSENNAKNSEKLSEQYASNSQKSADAAKQSELETARYLEFAQFADTDAALKAGQLEQYIAMLETMTRLLNDYQIVDVLLDSSGAPVLDSNGYEILTSIIGFEAFMRMVLKLQNEVAENRSDISYLAEDMARFRNSFKEYPMGEDIKDSSNESVLDNQGNPIGGQIIHLIK